jgi:hypothetical protein
VATPARTLEVHWVVSYTVTVSSSQAATVANRPSGLLVFSAVVNVASQVISAEEAGVDVPAPHVDAPRIGLQRTAGVAEVEQCVGGRVVELDQPCGRGRLLRRLGDHEPDVLAVVRQAVVLQRSLRRHAQDAERSALELRGVLVGDDRQDPWRSLGGDRADVADAPGGDGAAHERGVRHVGKAHIRRVGARRCPG